MTLSFRIRHMATLLGITHGDTRWKEEALGLLGERGTHCHHNLPADLRRLQPQLPSDYNHIRPQVRAAANCPAEPSQATEP